MTDFSLGNFSEIIKPTARNLGVVFDSDLTFTTHINKVVQSCFFYIWNNAKIKTILIQSDLEKGFYAHIFSRLYYCNLLLSGINQKALSHLQLVQNAAAGLLTGFSRWHHMEIKHHPHHTGRPNWTRRWASAGGDSAWAGISPEEGGKRCHVLNNDKTKDRGQVVDVSEKVRFYFNYTYLEEVERLNQRETAQRALQEENEGENSSCGIKVQEDAE